MFACRSFSSGAQGVTQSGENSLDARRIVRRVYITDLAPNREVDREGIEPSGRRFVAQP
jgi:hypothetical protein